MDERDVTPGIAAAAPDEDGDDDVVGHRFLTPDQAQARAEQVRSERDGRSSGDVRQPKTTEDRS
ncbi:MAG: hypothetical protein LH461_03990 [Spirochaetaceae bacterium]|nr:hypothetical protein [Spirochaetaceae bacterium]